MKEKSVAVLRQHNVTYDQEMEHEMHNFITKQVFSEEIKTDVLSVEKLGKDELKKLGKTDYLRMQPLAYGQRIRE